MNWVLIFTGGFALGAIICYKFFCKKKKRYQSNIKLGVIYMIDNIDHLFSVTDILSPTANAFDKPFEICETIKKIPQNQVIRIVLCTQGGCLTSCEKILKQLRKHKAGYIAYVKNECFSAGTLLALGAKEIVMTDDSYLGKIDPQISDMTGSYSAITYYNLAPEHVDATNIHEVRLSKQSINYLLDLLKFLNLDPEVEARVKAQMIFSDYPHNKTFDFQQCKDIGLNIRVPMSEETAFIDFSLSS
jgi:hypothetical protein